MLTKSNSEPVVFAPKLTRTWCEDLLHAHSKQSWNSRVLAAASRLEDQQLVEWQNEASLRACLEQPRIFAVELRCRRIVDLVTMKKILALFSSIPFALNCLKATPRRPEVSRNVIRKAYSELEE